MSDHVTSGECVFVDRGDWGDAVVCALFLVIFPITIIAIWTEPRDVAPLIFVVPFTVTFSLTVPFLARRVTRARTRRITVNRLARTIEVSVRRPLAPEPTRCIAMGDVHQLLFETTDNDGCWYRALLDLGDGEPIDFAQGNHRATAYSKAEEMAHALHLARPALEIVEVSG